jgi:hypothetical protein
VNSGERVFHRQLGWGIVQRVVQNGPRSGAWVDFGYTKEFLRVQDLQTADQVQMPVPPRRTVPEAKTAKPEPNLRLGSEEGLKPVQTAGDPGREESCPIEARKGVVALRLGQILESQVSQLSVGTGRLEGILRAQVARATGNKPAFVLVEGVWGGGKTHALTLLQALAREAGFTTSSVVMDGVGMSLSEPMQLMESVLSSLMFPRQLGVWNVGELMRSVVKEGRIPSIRLKGAPDLAGLLELMPTSAFDDPDALSLIQDYLSLSISASQAKQKLKLLGFSARLPTIRVSKLEERNHAFCVLVRNWANLLAAAGSKGLLLVLDELDVEYASTAFKDLSSGDRKERRTNLLLQLQQITGQKANLLIAFASAPGAPDEPENDCVENILAVFGPSITHVKVPVPDEHELVQLFGRLSAVYSKAYPCPDDTFACNHLESILRTLIDRHRRRADAVPRHFVRSAVEALDIFGACEKPFDELIRLIGGGQ